LIRLGGVPEIGTSASLREPVSDGIDFNSPHV
jgi:hypothetical protein